MKTQKNFKIIRNYAKALYDSAVTNHSFDIDFVSMSDIKVFLTNNKSIFGQMVSPIVSKNIKLQLVNVISTTLHLPPISKKFLILLINNGRISYFFEIFDYIKKIKAVKNNVKVVKVTSARVIADSGKEAIVKIINETIDQALEVEYLIDKSLLGGIIINYDSTEINYSLKGCLEKIKYI